MRPDSIMHIKIDICKQTRAIAVETLASTLGDVLKSKEQVSEKKTVDWWLGKLRENETLFPDGWYTPPPHGICVLYGIAEQTSRQNYKNLRQEEVWPKEDVYLGGKNEMGYLFASPVDRKTGIIGDFGMTIYVGNKQEIKDHLKRCMEINRKIFDFLEVGKKFLEINTFAETLFAKYGLTNGVVSTTDPAGKNLGHTIPGIYSDWTEREKNIFENGQTNWSSVKDLINKKRVFVNAVEETVVEPNMAITIEPRLTTIDNPSIPMGSFHTIGVINDDGSKEFLTNFDQIFDVVEMDYMME